MNEAVEDGDSSRLNSHTSRIERIRALGFDPYPPAREIKPDLDLASARTLPPGRTAAVTGRLLRVDRDQEGTRVHLADHVRAAATALSAAPAVHPLLELLRPGDIVNARVRGTARGPEITALRPAVVATVGLTEEYRTPIGQEKAVFDSEDAAKLLSRTAELLGHLRSMLAERGFTEVMLPVLNTNANVSPNLPFSTTSADGTELFLRTTFPYFERLHYSIRRAYQIGPMFRDEPAGFERDREFTMLCLGETFTDYDDMMDLGEALLRELALRVTGGTELVFLGERVDLAQPWRRLTVAAALREYADVDMQVCYDLDVLEKVVRVLGLEVPDSPYAAARGTIHHSMVLDTILKALVYPALRQPTYLTEFPDFFGGPARPVATGAPVKMRAEAFIAGVEVGETAAVTTDPAEVRAWHADMRTAKLAVDWRQPADESYLDTVDRGLLCPSVIAFGIERLLMLILRQDSISAVTGYTTDI